MFKARRIRPGAKMTLHKKGYKGYSYAPPHPSSAAAGQPPAATDAELLAELSNRSDTVLEAVDYIAAELPQSVLDNLPPELAEALGQWRSETLRWASAGSELMERLLPLLEKLGKRARVSALAEAKFEVGDPVETPHGRGIVRDLLSKPVWDDDDDDGRHYVVDGHIYAEDQLQPVAAVDRLGDVYEPADASPG